MIRINLVRKERKKERKKATISLGSDEMTKQLAFAGLFVIAIAVAAVMWFDINGTRKSVQRDLNSATQERNRLKKVKELVESLEAEKNKLQVRLDVLSDLKDNLRSPLQPVFFIYLAYQDNLKVIISEVVQKGENVNEYEITGIATKEDLNKFSDDLKKEPIVENLDIVSQIADRFKISVRFKPVSSMKAETLEEAGEAEGEPAPESGGGA